MGGMTGVGGVQDMGGAASVIGDAMSFIGGRQANEAQTEQSNANRVFNAQQADLNRQFQAQQTQQVENWETQMSDTAMQRRVSDLKAAGLNPLLAVGQGGATQPSVGAPSGSQASYGSIPNIQNAGQAFGQLGPQLAGVNAANAQAEASRASASLDAANEARVRAQNPYAGATAAAQLDSVKQGVQNLIQQAQNMQAEFRLTSQNADRVATDNRFQAEFDRLTNLGMDLSNQMKKLGFPELQQDARFYSGPQGAIATAAREMAKGTGVAGGMATAAGMAGASPAAQGLYEEARGWTTDRIADVADWLKAMLPKPAPGRPNISSR